MVAAPNVLEDARDGTERAQGNPRLAWLAVGVIIGAGVSVLLFGVDSEVTAPSSTVAPATTETTEPIIGGIGDVVGGFPDGLTGVTRSDGQSLELLVWPLRGEPYQRTIPVGASSPPGPVAFDVSGRRIATLLPVPDQAVGVLYSGVPLSAEIVATDVTGYAWHDSVPSQLAYTTSVDGELLLWVAPTDPSGPELVARAVGIEGRVSAWGDWGYAVQDGVRDRIVLFTETGEIKDSHPGRVLDSHPSGWLAVEDDGLSLLSAGGGARGIDRQGLDGEALAASFSDEGTALAALTMDGVLVVSLQDDSSLLESGGRPGVPQLAWSSDGRYVLYPGVRGIWVIDTRNGKIDEVLTTKTFTGLETIPLTTTP